MNDSDDQIAQFPRWLVSAGAVIAIMMAIAIFVTRWAGATGPTTVRVQSLAGSLAFAVLLAGPIYLAVRALCSGQREPLLPALLLVLIVTFTSFSVFLLGGLLVAILWGQAFARWSTPRRPSRTRVALATLGAVALGIASVAATFVHVDPYCWEQIGTRPAESVAPESESGFVWEVDTTAGRIGTQSVPPDTEAVSGGCSSDRVVPLEALGSSLLALAALGVGAAAGRRDGRLGRPR